MASAPKTGLGVVRGQVNAAFLLGLLAILGALAFEHIGGLYPCVLCLVQRWPYYVGLPLLAVAIGGWERFPTPITLSLIAGAAALFAWGALVGFYHAGVEWGVFAGPQSCVGVGDAISFDALSDLDSARVVPCDEVQFEILGISLAGLNFIVSGIVAGLLVKAGTRLFKRMRTQA